MISSASGPKEYTTVNGPCIPTTSTRIGSGDLAPLGRIGALSPDLASLPFRHGSPDPKLLARDYGEFETLVLNGTLTTDRLSGAGRGTPLWKEEIGIGTPTVGKVMPTQIFCIQHLEQSGEQRYLPTRL
jgi:hypothetical protein